MKNIVVITNSVVIMVSVFYTERFAIISMIVRIIPMKGIAVSSEFPCVCFSLDWEIYFVEILKNSKISKMNNF